MVIPYGLRYQMFLYSVTFIVFKCHQLYNEINDSIVSNAVLFINFIYR